MQNSHNLGILLVNTDTRRMLLPHQLAVAEAAPAAALDGVVDVVVVAEGEGALHEEEDGERVQRRDERDGQRVAAALGVNSIDILNFGRETGHKTGPCSRPTSVLGHY